jgi:hypothetical protein
MRAPVAQELVRSHDIEVDTATSFAEFDAAIRGIDSEPAAEVPQWNRCGLDRFWSVFGALCLGLQPLLSAWTHS